MLGFRKLMLFVFVLLLVLPSFAHAKAAPSFQLNFIEDGQRLKLSVKVSGAQDLYAYDLRVSFDSLRWELIHASSGMQGFAVQPIIEGDVVRYAHTLLGNAPGKTGKVTLVSLTFERKLPGESVFGLLSAKLVDSKIKSAMYEADVRITAADDGASAPDFSDIQGHWAESSIRDAASLGFVAGYPDGTFGPQGNVTRAEFAAMLARSLRLPVPPSEAPPFADSDEMPAWARDYSASAAAAGLLNGYEDGSFQASRQITRIEMAAMIVRSLGGDPETPTAPLSFRDQDRIPAWGTDAAARAVSTGLMQGLPGSLFAPDAMASRAEAVTVIMRLVRLHLQY